MSIFAITPDISGPKKTPISFFFPKKVVDLK